MTTASGAGRPAPSLGRRLLLGGSVLVCVALAVTGVAVWVALHRFVQAQVDGRLDGQIVAVADALRPVPGGGWRLERSVDGPPFDRPGSGWGWMVMAPGPVLRSASLLDRDVRFDTPEPAPAAPPRSPRHPPSGDGPEPPVPAGPPPDTAAGTGPGDEALHVRLRHLVIGPESVTILAAAPRHAIAGPLRDAIVPVALVLAGLAVLLIAGGIAQIWLGLRPLRMLEGVLAELRDGRLTRIAGPQPAELQPLVAELNALLDQHDSNLDRARRHVANLAHGLKTPLATLDLRLAESGGQAPLRPLVAAMDRMIRHHLGRARAAALGGPTRARVDLPARLADLQAAFTRLYAEKGASLEVVAPEGLAAACEAQDFDEILGNLVDNACRWAARQVRVEAVPDGTRLRITIGDDGPGLADDAMAEALRPGLRLDEQAPGYGFGLPIARELAELYGGSVELGRAALGGLAVTVTLPRAGSGR